MGCSSLCRHQVIQQTKLICLLEFLLITSFFCLLHHQSCFISPNRFHWFLLAASTQTSKSSEGLLSSRVNGWLVPVTSCWHENTLSWWLLRSTYFLNCFRKMPMFIPLLESRMLICEQECKSVVSDSLTRTWTSYDLWRPGLLLVQLPTATPCWSSPCGAMKSTGSHAQHTRLVTTGRTSVR